MEAKETEQKRRIGPGSDPVPAPFVSRSPLTEDTLTWQATGGFSIDASVRIEGKTARVWNASPTTALARPSPSCGFMPPTVSLRYSPRRLGRNRAVPHIAVPGASEHS